MSRYTMFQWPIGSGNIYTFWPIFVLNVLPMIEYTPKNDKLIPRIADPPCIGQKIQALRTGLNKDAMDLLRFLQDVFPHKHGEPGLEEDVHIHQFLLSHPYPPYKALKPQTQKRWFESKMTYLSRRGLMEQIFCKKKRNYWYSWSLA